MYVFILLLFLLQTRVIFDRTQDSVWPGAEASCHGPVTLTLPCLQPFLGY